VPTSLPSPHQDRETKYKEETEMCRPGCDVAMDTSGNHKAKTLNGSAVGCRTKNTPFSFIHLPLSNTHT